MSTTAPSPAVRSRRRSEVSVPPARRRPRIRLTARATVLFAMIGGVGILSIAPARLYLEQRAELGSMERRAAELEVENDRLSSRADQLRDPAYLERLARQCLGMVQPGETVFVAVPKQGAPAPPPDC
jgi:cell division protein FtsB